MGGGTCISGVLETVENCSPSQIDFYYNFQSHFLREYGICTILEQSVISLVGNVKATIKANSCWYMAKPIQYCKFKK